MGDQDNGASTLYDRLGGMEAIKLAVEQFYGRVLADPELQPFFAKTKMNWLKRRQGQFLAQVLGGPAAYAGQSMKAVHTHMAIESRHFDLVAGHLANTLKALSVAPSLVEEVIAVVATTKPDIVTR